MAANPCSLCLHQLRRSLLDPNKIWYVVSNEWFYKPSEFIRSDIFPFFKEDIAEVCIHDLIDGNGGIVDPSWFGSSRKKDTVFVSTLFGIVGRALRQKNLKQDEVVASKQFQQVRNLLNFLQFDLEMAARPNIPDPASTFQPGFIETPPATPAEETVGCSSLKQPIEELHKLDHCRGPRLFVKRAEALARSCIDSFGEDLTSGSDLGKLFGYGLLYTEESQQHFVKDVLSTALWTVAEKKGIKKAFNTSLCEDLTSDYVQSLRVPDWIQLYVKLATKLPNRSWQTLLL